MIIPECCGLHERWREMAREPLGFGPRYTPWIVLMRWLERINPEESDKSAMLAGWHIMNGLADVPMPAPVPGSSRPSAGKSPLRATP